MSVSRVDPEWQQITMKILDETISVTEERKLYTQDNFIADVGGYLGLLLGASALTLYDFIVDMGKRVMNKLYRVGKN